MTIVGFESTYFVGPFTKRVSFASQQARALNLVWAMLDEGSIKPKSHVAVVGGGLAGTTAAAALLQRNIKVTLFEQADRYFPLQWQTAIRFVHPTINFWPQMRLSPTTDLPLLVWSSNLCADVISAVEDQWNRFVNKLAGLQKPKKVLPFRRGKPAVQVLDGKRVQSIPFDAIIVASGYGLETGLPGTVARSYWENADLIRQGQPGDSFLISGAGDGGLLEVLRLVYPHFDFGRLTVALAAKLDQTAVAEKLAETESYALATTDRNERCTRLETAYMATMIPDNVVVETRAVVKAPGRVRLVAKDGLVFTPDSAPIHRLMLAEAIRAGAVEIEAGELVSSGNGLFVVEAPVGARYVDETVVVARHGTSKAISELLAEVDVNSLRAIQESLSKYQYDKFWPEGFFLAASEQPDGTPGSLNRMKGRLKYANHLKDSWPGVLFFSVMQEHRGGPWEYHLVVDQNDPNFDSSKIPTEIFGRPLRITYQTVPSATALTSESRPSAGSPLQPLRIGDKIEAAVLFGGRKWTSGRIGCFVERTGYDGVFAVTAAHVFGEDLPSGAHASSADSLKWRRVGELTNDSAATSLDIVAVHLADNISFESTNEIRFDEPVLDSELVDSKLAIANYKRGESSGRVCGLAIDVPINLPNGSKAFLKEAILVRAQSQDSAFTTSGDSGSLVVDEHKKPIGFAVAADSVNSYVVPFKLAMDALGAKPLAAGRIVNPVMKSESDHDFVVRKIDLSDRMYDLDQLAYRFRERSPLPPTGLSRTLGQVASLELWPASSAGLFDQALPTIRDWASHREFATASIYHLHGLTEFVRAAGLTRPRDLLSFFHDAPNLNQLNLFVGLDHDTAAKLSAHTIQRAVKGRPVTLQSATKILKAIEGTAQAVKSKDFGALHIAPAFYVLVGWVGQDAQRILEDTEVATSIDKLLGPNHMGLLREMAEGRLVTARTARAIQQFLKFAAWGQAEIYSPVSEGLRSGRAASVEHVEQLEAVIKVLEEEIARRS